MNIVKYKKSSIAVLIFLLLLFFLLYFINLRPKHKKLISNKVTPTAYVIAQKVMLPSYYRVSGTIEPNTKGQLAAQVNAMVKTVLVHNGDKVKKGEVLLTLDNRDYLAKLAQAKQNISATHALFQQQQLDFNRIKKLKKANYVSQSLYDQAQAQFLQSKARLEQAKKAVTEAQIALGYCQITAPSNGIVLERLVDPGDQAVLGKTLLILQTSQQLKLLVNVPAILINKIILGQKIAIHITNVNQEKITGTISEITPDIDPNTRTAAVKITIANAHNILPGMYGHAYLPIAKQSAIIIPKNTIIKDGQLSLVRILINNHISLNFIVTGRTINNNMIEVLSGLNANTKIVLPKNE